MKVLKFFIVAAMAAVATSAAAQDFSDPKYAKWGQTPEERKENILASSYLKEEVANRHFNSAARYLQQLLASCPDASENIYANGVKLYKDKANRAESLAEKRMYVDSILLLYDIRIANFGNHPKRGRVYLLERKAREYLTYKADDREGVAEAFEAAIAAQKEAGAVDAELVAIYFKNLCDDYQNDVVDAMTVVNAYDSHAQYFENLAPEKIQFKEQFEQCFGMSGAASCENLETIFSKKIADNPDDTKIVEQAFKLMARANCSSDFFFMVGEKHYAANKTSEVAMLLAQGFQDKKNFDKANQYLREALASETVAAEREKLFVRIGILDMSMNNFAAAVEAFREAQAINPENPHAPFFLAQCYVNGAKNCAGLQKDAIYWVAYDLIQKALPLLEAQDADRVEAAKQLAAAYRAAFPTKEECFFNELADGSSFTVNCGFASGIRTTVRPRVQ